MLSVLLAEHGASLLSRVRAGEAGDGPTEVQVIRFVDPAGFDAYMLDPRRSAMSARRDDAVARTEMQRVEVIAP